MPEMPDTGEDHGDPEPVGRFDHFSVTYRAAGLNGSGNAVLGRLLQTVRKWKKRIRRDYRTCQGQNGFHPTKLRTIDTAHLACADTEGLSCASVDDGVRFHVFADFPCEEQ